MTKIEQEILHLLKLHYDYITIGINLGQKSYCNYKNTKDNISSLSEIPKGLYEWMEKNYDREYIIGDFKIV